MYERLLELMEKNNISSYKLSKESGVTQATLSRWKTGKTSPSIETLQALADYFNVSLDYLSGKSGEPSSRLVNEAVDQNGKPAINEDSGLKRVNSLEMSEKIRLFRKQNNLTLEEIGNFVGVGKSTVRKWENGDIANMRRDKIAKLAAILNTSPAYLMGWDDTVSDESRSADAPLSKTKQDIMDAVLKMDEESAKALLQIVESVKSLRDK